MNHPEIIAAPFEMWVAPVGTAFPALADEPAAPWSKLGLHGARSYSEGGVSIEHRPQYGISTPAGPDAVPGNAFLTSDELRINVELIDLSLESYSLALSQAPISDTPRAPGSAGFRSIALAHSPRSMARLALLARGPSPYNDDMMAQYEVPVCRQIGSPTPTFQRGEPAGLALQFLALRNPSATSEDEIFGRLVAQDSPVLLAILRSEDGEPLMTSTGQFLEI